MKNFKEALSDFLIVFMVGGLFGAASDPSGLTLTDITQPNPQIAVTSSRPFNGKNDTPPGNAFSDDTTTRLLISGIEEAPDKKVDLVYTFETATNITSYGIYNYGSYYQDIRAPKTWTFCGSNDEGVTWEVLDEQLKESDWGGE